MGTWKHRLTDVDLDARTAVCSTCGPTTVRTKAGKRPRCRTVVERERVRVPTVHRPDERFHAHGITREEYDQRLEDQGGLCAICRIRTPDHIDHDHGCCDVKNGSCGECIRGLLCRNCNTGLGKFADSTEMLQRAIDYLTQKSPTPVM